MFRKLLTVAASGMLLSAPAQAIDLRVAVEEEVVAVTIGSSVEARLVDERGQTLGMLPAMQPLTMAAAGSQVQALNVRVGRIRVVPSRPEGLVFIGDRWFRGAAEAFAAEGRLTALNLVDLEAYLYGVVGAEMVASWPEEALKAQAIAARTYALFHWGRRQNQTHDIGDTVQWQVYRGAQYETDSVRRAVEATAGQVITFQGNVINAMYHSHSGGRTEDIKVYGEEDKPYLRTVEDFDQAAPYWKWQQVIPTVNLRKTFGLEAVGELLDVKVLERSTSGRILAVQFVGSKGSQLLKGTDVRLKLGLRSNFFEITPVGGSGQGPVTALTFDGRGFGHGLGMSQWGARALAALGWNCSRILKHYYQGVTLQKQIF